MSFLCAAHLSPRERKAPNGRSLSLHADGRRLALAVSIAQNLNGRDPKDKTYSGGSAKIHLLEFPAVEIPPVEAPKSE